MTSTPSGDTHQDFESARSLFESGQKLFLPKDGNVILSRLIAVYVKERIQRLYKQGDRSLLSHSQSREGREQGRTHDL